MEVVRYAQCWEDADVLIEALDVQRAHSCLAIASAGDNALALLSCSPRRVIAIDYNAAQIACLELRVAAYGVLDDEELLRFLGAREGRDRLALYAHCRRHLSHSARTYWDGQPEVIERGIIGQGKFERYLALFRNRILPLIESDAAIESLLTPKSREMRAEFFETVWNNWRWRFAFRMFFSQTTMSALGRERAFFAYAEEEVSDHLLGRIRHAFVDLDPSKNPYLHWILTGTYGDVLPYSLRSQNVAQIRRNLGRLTWSVDSLESYLAKSADRFDRFALSDVFEYMSVPQYEEALRLISAHSRPSARLVYWNMIVPRARTEAFVGQIESESERAKILHDAENAFFYSNLVIESVT